MERKNCAFIADVKNIWTPKVINNSKSGKNIIDRYMYTSVENFTWIAILNL